MNLTDVDFLCLSVFFTRLQIFVCLFSFCLNFILIFYFNPIKIFVDLRPSSHSIRFCSKSHQDLFYAFKEFDSLINNGGQILTDPFLQLQQQQQQDHGESESKPKPLVNYATISSLTLPRTSKTEICEFSKHHSQYDTLV